MMAIIGITTGITGFLLHQVFVLFRNASITLSDFNSVSVYDGGITGFLLHQVIDVIADFKWEFAKRFLLDGNLLLSWLTASTYRSSSSSLSSSSSSSFYHHHLLLSWLTASTYSLALVLVSTAIVVLIRPCAAGSDFLYFCIFYSFSLWSSSNNVLQVLAHRSLSASSMER